MKNIMLSTETYYDKMYACWLGKNIGGTLGAPYESFKWVNDLDFYRPVPDKSAPNDDLDLQLVWLKMLEEINGVPELQDFAVYWKKYLITFPWDEYGFCSRNLERGLLPPVSGWFENSFIDNMGSPIRSEIWACLFPADPQAAAAIAWKDSAMDHAGGEGTYGEMFWAAVESAAFVESDPMTLIPIGLAMIPAQCGIARVIRDAIWCWENGKSWAEARLKIATYYGREHPCDAIPNHGFTILGWLYGKDFGDKLCKAVNCGYDTDCTGATLGSVLGIIGGRQGIPQKWLEPIGEQIILCRWTGKFNAPKTIKELSDRMLKLTERYARNSTISLGQKTQLPKDLRSLLFRNERARAVAQTDPLSAILKKNGITVQLHYNGEPVLWPNITRTVEVTATREGRPLAADLQLRAPKGWQVTRKDRNIFDLHSAKVADRNQLTVVVRSLGSDLRFAFAMFGPGEARGFDVGANVPRCPRCLARSPYCLCPL